jgi:hypothetical protein
MHSFREPPLSFLFALFHWVMFVRMAYILGREKPFSRPADMRELAWLLGLRGPKMLVLSGGAPLIVILAIELFFLNVSLTPFIETRLLNEILLPAVAVIDFFLGAAVSLLWLRTKSSVGPRKATAARLFWTAASVILFSSCALLILH